MQGITALVGPSGSGKTTLLRALAGLASGMTGERRVRFRGREWDDGVQSVPVEDRRVGFVFQEPNLFGHLNVAGNIGYGARRRQVASFGGIVDALDLQGMMDREVAGLSGGEMRRVALARALASDPAVLFLDEPMSGLDSQRKADFLPYIARAVTQAQVPAIYVSHGVDEVVALADRVLEMSNGRIVGWRSPPMRLMGHVVAEVAGGVEVRIDGAEEAGVPASLTVPLRAVVGEAVGLGLSPDGVLFSDTNPGAGSALAILPVDVVRDASEAGGALVRVLEQQVAVPETIRLPQSRKLWLSILRVHPRPMSGDSAA